VKGGAIWSSNHIIETPEEQDVFGLIGVPFIAPELRMK
jgi:DNA polymerase/3'-5' exonuclease PolX